MFQLYFLIFPDIFRKAVAKFCVRSLIKTVCAIIKGLKASTYCKACFQKGLDKNDCF